ncbi:MULTISPECIES: copper resistance protein CopC [unclassified Streptomyces]|uniref:copper resistance protein CopC n=1 Tax=unclassified Streptomyces TaxID=2593676 RepID=UPI0005A6B037|nr:MULTISPECIES: copper resistance protein CopC [unclassified Streptomyces]ODA72891.1 Copper resistance protein CopC [Streptomyces sp. AVP053U2]
MRGLRLLRAPAVLLGCLCALLLLGSAPAYAHTALKDATPAPGAEAGSGTSVVALTFDRLMPGTTPEIGLTGPDGTTVPVGQPVLADGSVACAAVTPLRAGVTTLTYTVTATDGDTQTNAFQFQVVDGTEPVATPSVCQGLTLSAPDAGGDDTLPGLSRTTALVVLAGVVVAVVGAGVLAVRGLRGAGPTGRRRGAPV